MFVLGYSDRKEIAEQKENVMDEGWSSYEKTVLLLAVCVLLTFCIVAAWSWVLLLLGDIQGGGPIGMLMEILPLHLLV